MELKLRKYIILGFFFLILIVYAVKILTIQLSAEKYQERIYQNIVQEITLYPDRGLIFDRYDKILAANKPVYTLKVVPYRLSLIKKHLERGDEVQNFDTTLFLQILDISLDEFEERMDKARAHSPYSASEFMKLIPESQAALIKENIYKFPGFYIEKHSIRDYPLHIGAHILGYISEVSPNDIKKNPEYKKGDYKGKRGLEAYYDKELRGEKGVKYMLLDNRRRVIGSYRNGDNDKLPVAGKDLKTGIIAQLQEYAEWLLAGKRGAVVAIEPKTGDILVMASSPTYDPNLLTGKNFSKNYAKLTSDNINKPIYNRAIQAEYPPGSTFKTVQALVALQENVINTKTHYVCGGGYHIGRHIIKCHHHGVDVDFHYSIQNSCNTYYCNVYMNFLQDKRFGNVHQAYDHWRDLVMQFGLGHRLGVDLPNEKSGSLPDSKALGVAFRDTAWRAGRVISMAIGQGNMLVTPLQLANYATVIANRGYYYTPHIVTQVGDSVLKYDKHYVAVDTQWFTPVIDAMEDVLNYGGTAPGSRVEGIEICGKTGTAQNPFGKDHSVFIAFAPKDNPQIAVAVYIEHGGYGSNIAAPIATLIIEKYLTGKVKEKYREDYVRSYYIDYSKSKPM